MMATELSLVSEKSSPGGGPMTPVLAPPLPGVLGAYHGEPPFVASPASRARTIVWERSATSSFVKMLETGGWLFGGAGGSLAGVAGTLKLPSRSKVTLAKQRPKNTDARQRGPFMTTPRMTCPAAPRAACSPAPTDEISWTVRTAMTRYAALAVMTRCSGEGPAATSSTACRATTSYTALAARARTTPAVT